MSAERSSETADANSTQASAHGRSATVARSSQTGRVDVWRGGCRGGMSVFAPFVWRCPSTQAMAPFPRPAHRTGHADRPHPTLGQNFTPSFSPSHAPTWSGVRARGARTGARGDSFHPCVAEPCACGVATDATARRCSGRARGTHRCPCLDGDQVPCRDVAHFRHHLSHGRCQSGMSGAAARTRIVEDAFRGLFAMDRGCGQGARAREGGGLDSAAIRPQICEVRAAIPMN